MEPGKTPVKPYVFVNRAVSPAGAAKSPDWGRRESSVIGVAIGPRQRYGW
jgi:hypothetical protein